MNGLSRIALAAAALLGTAPMAAAQTDGRFAVGASFSSSSATAGDVRGNGGGLGLLWRLNSDREGWGFKYGTNWYSADIDTELEGTQQAFGRIRVRPIMVGYGYTTFIGRTKVSANLMGGYSFNSFKLQPGATALYQRQFNTDAVETDASNGFVMKPEVTAWFDVTRKIGITVGAGYMVARPTVSVMTPTGPERHGVNADLLMFKVGAVYSVF